jgi:uncharacterized membrane protein
MTILRMISRWLLAALMIGAGVMHFVNPGFFLKIMPPYLPYHLELVYFSGVCEIVLGILLLIPRYRRLAGWGIIALLIAVFPANIYVYQHQEIIPASPAVAGSVHSDGVWADETDRAGERSARKPFASQLTEEA